jgi:hypothetical protein
MSFRASSIARGATNRNAYEALLGRHYINGPADSITIEIVSARPFQPHRKVIDDVEGWMVG